MFSARRGASGLMEAELAVLEGALESSNELAAEDATEHFDRKKEGVACVDPMCDREITHQRESHNAHADEVRVSDSKCVAR
jgi:hypothetical protein